ncbi:MAG: hypothetical protein E4H27_08645 [Anaerolineales bacterium]|nr:MAG: hypothetical protein E4H27_08645 [Anaerolineales bacterium]
MKLPTIAVFALTLLALTVFDTSAQQPYPQMPFNMDELQKVQTEYQDLKKQNEQERKIITNEIAAKELARAKKEQATTGSFNDPYAVAEMRTRERLQVLTTEWKKEDQELEVQMHEKMMQNSGMGDMYKMQQEMMESYGYTVPPAK